MIAIQKIPIPLLNIIQGRPLTNYLTANCLQGFNPCCHKPHELDNSKHPLYKEHQGLFQSNLGALKLFYDQHGIFGSGDVNPSLRFTWKPPMDEKARQFLRDPKSDPSDFWAMSSSENLMICNKCDLRGDAILFMRIYLADQKDRKPCESLRLASAEDAHNYLQRVAANSQQFREFMEFLPSELATDIEGHQFSGLYHVAFYQGSRPAWEVDGCRKWFEENFGIKQEILQKYEIRYIEDGQHFKEVLLKHPRVKNRHDLVASGLLAPNEEAAFQEGTILFPFKKGSTITYLYGWQIPILNGNPMGRFSKKLFIEGHIPLFNQNAILQSNGIRPIFFCDNLANVLIFASLGYPAIGIPNFYFLNRNHLQPFQEAQNILGEERALRIIVAFDRYTRAQKITSDFIESLKKLGVDIREFNLPAGFEYLKDFYRCRPSSFDLNAYIHQYGSMGRPLLT